MPEEANRSNSIYGSNVEPCTVVLFGASGDLAKRKVIPALYDLAQHNSLGQRYSIVGFSRTPMTDESFRSTIGEAAKTISEVGPIDPEKWKDFASNLYYSAGDYSDPNAYAELAKKWPVISEKGEAPADAKQWDAVKDKLKLLEQ